MGDLIAVILIFLSLPIFWWFMKLIMKLGELNKIQRALYVLHHKDGDDLMTKFNIKNRDTYEEIVADSFRAVQQARRDGSISFNKEVSREGDIREL